jgi:hypothetical protein
MKDFKIHFHITNADGLDESDELIVPAKNKEAAKEFFLGIVTHIAQKALITCKDGIRKMVPLEGSKIKVTKVVQEAK